MPQTLLPQHVRLRVAPAVACPFPGVPAAYWAATYAAAIFPAATMGSTVRCARQRTKAPSSAESTASARSRSPRRSVSATVHCSKTSAVARRKSSLVLATSRATVAIGHASSKFVNASVRAAPSNTARTDAFPGTELLHTGLAWAVAWFAGERTRLRREHIAELEERALRAEREAERERRLAAAEERARIARDLHDSAGHAISVIAVRAGAARLRHDEDPERSRLALEAIEQVARQTVAEIDEIFGTLRDGRSPRGAVEAPPGLASLDALVERHTSAGLT